MSEQFFDNARKIKLKKFSGTVELPPEGSKARELLLRKIKVDEEWWEKMLARMAELI